LPVGGGRVHGPAKVSRNCQSKVHNTIDSASWDGLHGKDCAKVSHRSPAAYPPRQGAPHGLSAAGRDHRNALDLRGVDSAAIKSADFTSNRLMANMGQVYCDDGSRKETEAGEEEIRFDDLTKRMIKVTPEELRRRLGIQKAAKQSAESNQEQDRKDKS